MSISSGGPKYEKNFWGSLGTIVKRRRVFGIKLVPD